MPIVECGINEIFGLSVEAFGIDFGSCRIASANCASELACGRRDGADPDNRRGQGFHRRCPFVCRSDGTIEI